MADEDNKPTFDAIAALDQVGTALENMGAILAGYYHSLMAAGIPEDMARDMVMRFYQTWVERTFQKP